MIVAGSPVAGGELVAASRVTCVATSLAVAVADTVTSADRPRVPPTCCDTFSMAEATPESRRSTPATAVSVIGTNTCPSPTPTNAIAGRTSAT